MRLQNFISTENHKSVSLSLFLARSLLSTMCTYPFGTWSQQRLLKQFKSAASLQNLSKYLSIRAPAFSCRRHIYFQFAVAIRISCTKISPADAKLDAPQTWFSTALIVCHGVTSELTKSLSLRRKTWQWELRRNLEISWESSGPKFSQKCK